MVEFDDLVSPPPPPPSRGQRTGRMPGIAAGSWDPIGSVAPPPPPGSGFRGGQGSASTIGSGDLLASGLQSVGTGRLKVDLTTSLESLFFHAMLLTGGISLLTLFTAATGEKGAFPIFFGTLIPFGIAFALYRLTDNYYVVDLRNKLFLFHFHFGPIDFDSTVAPFSRIVACTTTSVHKSRKSGKHGPTRHWWEYATVVVLDTGKIIPVSDFSSEALTAKNVLAERLAKVFQARHVSGRPKCIPVIKRDPKGTIVVVQEQPSQLWILVLVFFGFALFFAAKVFGLIH